MSGGHQHGEESDNGASDPFAAPREDMIENQLRRRGVRDHAVIDAMRAIPRQLFIEFDLQEHAYDDEALPSQEGQTISQPFMVGIMTQELALRPGNRVLEIGTGTGYQTAILAHLVGPQGQVFSIERQPLLAEFARSRLQALNIQNVQMRVGDGSLGWPAEGSAQPRFDRILVTAGSPQLPAPLLEQLAPGGILVAPIGNAESQMLMRFARHGDQIATKELLACRFVPLVGEHGWKTAKSKP